MLGFAISTTACSRGELTDPDDSASGPFADTCRPAPQPTVGQRFGDSDRQAITSVAVDRHGYPLIAGGFRGTVELDGNVLHGPATPPNQVGTDALAPDGQLFVARLAPEGCSPFINSFGPADLALNANVATDAEDNVLFTTTYFGIVDFGGGPIQSSPSNTYGAAIAKYGPSGEHQWSLGITSSSTVATVGKAATDALGNIYIAGYFEWELSVGGAILGKSLERDGFVVKLDPAGNIVWSKILKLSMKHETNLTITVSPEGTSTISGECAQDPSGVPVDLGGGPQMEVSGSGFVTRFDTNGNHLWGKVLPNRIQASATDSTGATFLVHDAPPETLAVTKLDAFGVEVSTVTPPLETYWGYAREGRHLVVGPDGAPILFGGLAQEGATVLAAQLTSEGAIAWSRRYTTSGEFGPRVDIALGLSGRMWVAGSFEGDLDLGQGTLSSAGSSDAFLAEIAP
ncbi:MAG: hypothetical protein U0271_38455 [Polyangiaceae bacterium]